NIVRSVAQGVLETSPGAPLTQAQQETITRIARTLVNNTETFQAAAQRQAQRSQERDVLITKVLLNVAKAIAIVIALLVLRAIIGAMGRGVIAENAQAVTSVLIPTATEEEAENLGQALINKRFAASGNITSPVRSILRREDRIENTSGFLLVLKTTQFNVPAIIGHVVEHTKFNVPDIISLPNATAHDPDLDWVLKQESPVWWKRIWPFGGNRT
ncbi:MAG: divalent cation tolerance protein CutA, partial [bacterium]|nr:divalent cation tolerance protein CutA [bacterium]